MRGSTKTFLGRGLIVWSAGRLLITLLLFLAGINPLARSIAWSIGIVLGTCGLGYIDCGIRHERALWTNLGISRLAIAVWHGVPAGIGEIVVMTIGLTLQ